jgi:hypothetical protein
VNSILETDGYKFSMAEAGWPLREETFYYSHRKGGPALIPFDIPAYIKKLLPFCSQKDAAYLEANEYSLGIGAQTAYRDHEALKITALPARNGNPAGFIRQLELGDQKFKLFNGDGND